MENFLSILYTTIITTIIWFIVGGILYMNPIVAKIYKKYSKDYLIKGWFSQKKYLLATFFVAGFVPILFITFSYEIIAPLGFITFALLLLAIRIVPRLCDNWVQTKYPNQIILIELINGSILSFLIAYIITKI